MIVGVGQFVNRPHEVSDLKDPLDMIQKAVQRAAEDAGVSSIMKKVDTLCLVNILSASYPDPAGMTAERLDIHPSSRYYTWIGASAPQWFMNRTAERIAKGECRLALICGGTHYCTND